MDIMQSILDGETTPKLKGIEEFENFIQIVKTLIVVNLLKLTD